MAVQFETVKLEKGQVAVIRTELTVGQARAQRQLRRKLLDPEFGEGYEVPTEKADLEKLTEEEKEKAQDYTLVALLITTSVGVTKWEGDLEGCEGDWCKRPRTVEDYQRRMDWLEDNLGADDLVRVAGEIGKRLSLTDEERDAVGKPSNGDGP